MSNDTTKFEALIREKLGLKADSISSRQINKALQGRRVACGMPDLETYFHYLETNKQEWWELVDHIIVPETWFFRHREAFRFLQHYIKTEWLTQKLPPKLNLLSVPCSTGEEPYSLAITLLETGLTPKQFSIDAIDISHRGLQKAKKAIYSENSFRESEIPEKNRYFRRVLTEYHLCDAVREMVNFQQANLLDPLLNLHKSYHIIFCRHLLIYLDFSARNRAIDVLERLLIPPGFLFVGSPEITLFKPPRFEVVDYPYSFVYQKKAQTSPKVVPVQKQQRTKQPVTKLEKIPLIVTTNTQPSITHNQLDLARGLADQGKLDEATQLCQTYLHQYPTASQAYLLLGEIYQAKEDAQQAEEYFQKVLYLDPSSLEALTHLVLIKESRGDIKGVNLIKQRIERLRDKTL